MMQRTKDNSVNVGKNIFWCFPLADYERLSGHAEREQMQIRDREVSSK
jgi:hypothetical protein